MRQISIDIAVGENSNTFTPTMLIKMTRKPLKLLSKVQVTCSKQRFDSSTTMRSKIGRAKKTC